MNTREPILKPGDEIRVIAPSQSWSQKKHHKSYDRAKQRLESLGYKITYAKNIQKSYHLGTATRQDRANDFMDAYSDKNVRMVLALTGGWSANEILPLIDWKVVRANPKPLMGFSDITVLLNAIYAKTGQRGFLGPNFSTFGRMPEWQYSLEVFQRVVSGEPTRLEKSKRWGERGRKRYKTTPWKALQAGQAEAVLLGGNLGTLYLLQGTDYQPAFDTPFIFALEDDDEAGIYTAKEVSRRFESLLQIPGFRKNLKGLLIGRFPRGSKLTQSELESIVSSKNLGKIPIASGVDFGHTLPMVTLPIGGLVRLRVSEDVELTVL